VKDSVIMLCLTASREKKSGNRAEKNPTRNWRSGLGHRVVGKDSGKSRYRKRVKQCGRLQYQERVMFVPLRFNTDG
jgi:hypothetical protein